MPTITLKDGVVSATVYIQVTREHKCVCGANYTITLEIPEGVSYKGQINVTGVNCPHCGEPAVIPHGIHYIENYQLLTK
jgi:hypothetical protein